MGYEIDDLIHFLQDLAGWKGVRQVWVHGQFPAQVIVEASGGLSEEAFAMRSELYERIEEHFISYAVSEHLNVEYRIVPVGEDISPPHIPKGAIPVAPAVAARSG